MKRLIFILFVCYGMFCFSCGTEKDSDFPEWLSTAIKEMETLHAGDVSIVKIKIFEGEWRNKKFYYIYNNLSSCMFCKVYYDNGEKIEWSDQDISFDNFCSTSKNWKLIYEFGDFNWE